MKKINILFIHKCSEYAAIAHKEQFRKDKETPYITHPARVAFMCTYSKFLSTELVCAAWLHDVLEDCSKSTSTQINSIFNHSVSFGDFLLDELGYSPMLKISQIVSEVSDLLSKDIDKKQRRIAMYKTLSQTSYPESRTLKFLDRVDNLQTINCFTEKGRSFYISDTHNMIKTFGEQVKLEDRPVYNMLLTELNKQELMKGY